MRRIGVIELTVGYGNFDCASTVGLELPDIRWNEAMYFINAYNARLQAGSLRVRFPRRELYYHISCDCGTQTPSRDLIHEIIETARNLWPKIGSRLQSAVTRTGSMEHALQGLEGYEKYVSNGRETKDYDPRLTYEDASIETTQESKDDRPADAGSGDIDVESSDKKG